jgi:hypothetical protein
LNPINFRYIARITLRKPYANVLIVLAAKSSLPSFESQLNGIISLESILGMKWVTREKAKVDRIACPWLIKKFVDSKPEFLFVPADKVLEVAKKENAVPFDIPNIELGHHADAV